MDWYRLWPTFWRQNYKTDLEWDKLLNAALDRYEVKRGIVHTVNIGPLKVWVSNWPYAYGHPCRMSEFSKEVLPKVSTRLRLSKAAEALEKPKELAQKRARLELWREVYKGDINADGH